ncbi:NfeD family protein [Bacillus sp. 165]|uniref:NfeD family protein n=1 Tax=Bacillus sp. 165 TaxID=1529117 RepID=UPI001AD9C28F|nr:NfeD family protein [Bacillus sp. 165]MBO9129166.1 NfeD family protein [Bacillus sp. 165]
MSAWGYGILDIYLLGLITMGGIALLFLIFGDILDAIANIGLGTSLSLTMLFSFFAILCGTGYILEYLLSWGSLSIFIIAFLSAFISVLLMKIFIFVPISRSEQNTAFTLQDLIGQKGEVLITIPVNGMGEVFIQSKFGSNGMSAKSVRHREIRQGAMVSITAIEDGVLIVEQLEQESDF